MRAEPQCIKWILWNVYRMWHWWKKCWWDDIATKRSQLCPFWKVSILLFPGECMNGYLCIKARILIGITDVHRQTCGCYELCNTVVDEPVWVRWFLHAVFKTVDVKEEEERRTKGTEWKQYHWTKFPSPAFSSGDIRFCSIFLKPTPLADNTVYVNIKDLS